MNNELKRYTSWFVIIGVLSMVNSLIWWFKFADIYFVIGLGITQFIDGFSYGFLGDKGVGLALIINMIISGLFILTAMLANKGYKMIYYIAIVIYAFDAVLLLFFEDLMGVGFHALALFFLFKGAKILKENSEETNESYTDENQII